MPLYLFVLLIFSLAYLSDICKVFLISNLFAKRALNFTAHSLQKLCLLRVNTIQQLVLTAHPYSLIFVFSLYLQYFYSFSSMSYKISIPIHHLGIHNLFAQLPLNHTVFTKVVLLQSLSISFFCQGILSLLFAFLIYSYSVSFAFLFFPGHPF